MSWHGHVSVALAAVSLCAAQRLLAEVGDAEPAAAQSRDSAHPAAAHVEPPQRPRVVFSLTSVKARIPLTKPVLDVLVSGQTHSLDAVYLAVPPDVEELPGWLQQYNKTSERPGVLKVLHMSSDYGPASKLLAALREGGERSHETIVIYGDDDVLYGSRVAELHVAAHMAASAPAAFGSRAISIGTGSRWERLLEATGSVSVRASVLPDAAFAVGSMPDACRLSDDYWLSHHLTSAGVSLETLPECIFDFNSGTWPETCGVPFHTLPEVEQIGALSSVQLDPETGAASRAGGDWRDQLRRYEVCQGLLLPA